MPERTRSEDNKKQQFSWTAGFRNDRKLLACHRLSFSPDAVKQIVVFVVRSVVVAERHARGAARNPGPPNNETGFDSFTTGLRNERTASAGPKWLP
jgi:hypothetical protein